jgi:glycosyltransferase involved in cell wall biosynthesis
MNIVITHTDFRIYWQARLNALSRFLHDRNISLDIVEIADSGSHYDFSGRVHKYSDKWHCLFPNKRIEEVNPHVANKRLREKLDELSPDIVIAGAIAFFSGAAAVRWATENRKKVIIFDDARLQDIPRSAYVNYIKRRIFTCINAVFCPSSASNETFNFFGVKNEQIFYGVDTIDNLFWQDTKMANHLGDLPETYFLTIGRQIPIKNFLFLLKAYSEYVNRSENENLNPYHLVIIGSGTEHNNLVQFALTKQLKTIHFLPPMSQEVLKEVYKKASVFILPSTRETWGLVVNEAMASGLPVLVSNQAGCASTLIKEGINGYSFSPENLQELSTLLLKMHKLSLTERESMGQKSIEIISEWGLDRFCNGIFEAIQFVSGQVQKNPGLLTWTILKLWKGRYRPI